MFNRLASPVGLSREGGSSMSWSFETEVIGLPEPREEFPNYKVDASDLCRVAPSWQTNHSDPAGRSDGLQDLKQRLQASVRGLQDRSRNKAASCGLQDHFSSSLEFERLQASVRGLQDQRREQPSSCNSNSIDVNSAFRHEKSSSSTIEIDANSAFRHEKSSSSTFEASLLSGQVAGLLEQQVKQQLLLDTMAADQSSSHVQHGKDLAELVEVLTNLQGEVSTLRQCAVQEAALPSLVAHICEGFIIDHLRQQGEGFEFNLKTAELHIEKRCSEQIQSSSSELLQQAKRTSARQTASMQSTMEQQAEQIHIGLRQGIDDEFKRVQGALTKLSEEVEVQAQDFEQSIYLTRSEFHENNTNFEMDVARTRRQSQELREAQSEVQLEGVRAIEDLMNSIGGKIQESEDASFIRLCATRDAQQESLAETRQDLSERVSEGLRCLSENFHQQLLAHEYSSQLNLQETNMECEKVTEQLKKQLGEQQQRLGEVKSTMEADRLSVNDKVDDARAEALQLYTKIQNEVAEESVVIQQLVQEQQAALKAVQAELQLQVETVSQASQSAYDSLRGDQHREAEKESERCLSLEEKILTCEAFGVTLQEDLRRLGNEAQSEGTRLSELERECASIEKLDQRILDVEELVLQKCLELSESFNNQFSGLAADLGALKDFTETGLEISQARTQALSGMVEDNKESTQALSSVVEENKEHARADVEDLRIVVEESQKVTLASTQALRSDIEKLQQKVEEKQEEISSMVKEFEKQMEKRFGGIDSDIAEASEQAKVALGDAVAQLNSRVDGCAIEASTAAKVAMKQRAAAGVDCDEKVKELRDSFGKDNYQLLAYTKRLAEQNSVDLASQLGIKFESQLKQLTDNDSDLSSQLKQLADLNTKLQNTVDEQGSRYLKRIQDVEDLVCIFQKDFQGKISKVDQERMQSQRELEDHVSKIDKEYTQSQKYIQTQFSKVEQENARNQKFVADAVSTIHQQQVQARKDFEDIAIAKTTDERTFFEEDVIQIGNDGLESVEKVVVGTSWTERTNGSVSKIEQDLKSMGKRDGYSSMAEKRSNLLETSRANSSGAEASLNRGLTKPEYFMLAKVEQDLLQTQERKIVGSPGDARLNIILGSSGGESMLTRHNYVSNAEKVDSPIGKASSKAAAKGVIAEQLAVWKAREEEQKVTNVRLNMKQK